jgi:ATP-binding cassette, subfamily C, bacterial LapB
MNTDQSQSVIPPTSTFIWAIQKLAQMQGTSVETLRVQAATDTHIGTINPLNTVRQIARQMDWPKPRQISKPDRAELPLLIFEPENGWGLLVQQTPQGNWVIFTEQGPIEISEKLRQGATIVRLRLSTVINLGTALWTGETDEAEKKSFIYQVRQTLKQYRRQLIEASLASGFIALLALATSLFSMQVYDRVIPSRSEYTLIMLSLGVLLSIVIEMIMKFARTKVMDHVTAGLDAKLSREIFHRLMQLRIDQLPGSVGSLASQLRGYEQVRGFYTANTLFTLVELPVALLFIVIIMLIASPWVGVVPLLFGGLALYIGQQLRQKINRQAMEGAALTNMKTGLLVEAVEGIETIKAGSGGWKFLSRWIHVNNQTIQSDLKMRHITESVNYLAGSLQQISYAVLVAIGALLVMQGHMTTGALIACSILSGRIMSPILALPGLLVQKAHAQAAMQGLERLYQLKTDDHGVEQLLTPERIHGHYLLSDIKYAYGDAPPVLNIPKLEIQPGERIALLGPIGAGKSTLLRLLAGLYYPQQGQILLDGLDISHIDRQIISQHIGFLQQDHRLFQGTLRENLLIGLPDPGDQAIIDAMQKTGMDRFVAVHPKGLALPISEGGKGLSGGQKQLMAFTRLVLCNPNILLLDEPTANMDEEQERRCLQSLVQMAQQGKSMVIVTHKASILPLVNRVIVVGARGIIMDGPKEVIMKRLQPQHATTSPPSPAVTPGPQPRNAPTLVKIESTQTPDTPKITPHAV